MIYLHAIQMELRYFLYYVFNYEGCLNDDLDVPKAFDGLYKRISTLSRIKTQGMLSVEHCEKTRKALEGIDRVLQVVF